MLFLSFHKTSSDSVPSILDLLCGKQTNKKELIGFANLNILCMKTGLLFSLRKWNRRYTGIDFIWQPK